jgi:hypothetical protein
LTEKDHGEGGEQPPRGPSPDDGTLEAGYAEEEETSSPADVTLGGYLTLHNRPPAFEGADGNPYTVSMEVEKTPDLSAPYAGYLVFPRWADTGAGIVGHVETHLLMRGTSEAEVMGALEALSLVEVYRLLSEAIARRNEEIN